MWLDFICKVYNEAERVGQKIWTPFKLAWFT